MEHLKLSDLARQIGKYEHGGRDNYVSVKRDSYSSVDHWLSWGSRVASLQFSTGLDLLFDVHRDKTVDHVVLRGWRPNYVLGMYKENPNSTIWELGRRIAQDESDSVPNKHSGYRDEVEFRTDYQQIVNGRLVKRDFGYFAVPIFNLGNFDQKAQAVFNAEKRLWLTFEQEVARLYLDSKKPLDEVKVLRSLSLHVLAPITTLLPRRETK